MRPENEAYNFAHKGIWEKVDFESLTNEEVCYQGFASDTLLHCAARAAKLNLIPKRYLTHKNLLLKRAGGATVYKEAAEYGTIDQIPAELLTKEVLLKSTKDCPSILSVLLSYNHLQLLPKKS